LIKFILAFFGLFLNFILLSSPKIVFGQVAGQIPNLGQNQQAALQDGSLEARNIIEQLGFESLKENAIDFTAQNLEGKEVKLSHLKGRWIWLAFWATWCGPCKVEMPILEEIYKKIPPNNFSLIGISIDQLQLPQIRKFLDGNSITFPNWHDSMGAAQSNYDASAVPSIYLISPDFKLVGIYRGARDWNQPHILPLLNKLVTFKNAQAPINTENSTVPANSQVPNKLPPPKMKVSSWPNELKVGEKFPFQIEVSFQNSSTDYLITPPTIKLPPEIHSTPLESESYTTTNGSQLIYSTNLLFTKKGSYKIGPIDISYQNRQGSNVLYSQLHAKSVMIISQSDVLEKYLKNNFNFIVFILFFFILIIGLALFYFIRKRAKVKLNLANVEEVIANQKVLTFLKEIDILFNQKKSLQLNNYQKKLIELNINLMENFSSVEVNFDNEIIEKWKRKIEKIQFANLILDEWEVSFLEKNLQQFSKKYEGNPT
jgi:thiol-disulfide isomerase/thioredoxin